MAKYIKVEDQTFKECVQIYFDFYVQKVGLKPRFDQKQGKCMKELIKWMQSNIKPGFEVQDFCRTIFDNYNLWEPFFQNQLNLNQILSNINNICNNIKNGQSINNTNKSKQYRSRKEQILRRAGETNGEGGIQKNIGV